MFKIEGVRFELTIRRELNLQFSGLTRFTHPSFWKDLMLWTNDYKYDYLFSKQKFVQDFHGLKPIRKLAVNVTKTI